MGYRRAGFTVIGVDITPQPHYPFEFRQADAITFPLDGFDAIHASPPCQAYTRKTATWGRKRTTERHHPNLLPAIRERLIASGKPWVIENVAGAPMNATLMLCGTMFGLPLLKHRYFEANWPLPFAPFACRHEQVYNPWSGPGRTAEKFRQAQGTPWIPTAGGASRLAGVTGDLYNAIPPAYTEYIGQELIKAIREQRRAEHDRYHETGMCYGDSHAWFVERENEPTNQHGRQTRYEGDGRCPD